VCVCVCPGQYCGEGYNRFPLLHMECNALWQQQQRRCLKRCITFELVTLDSPGWQVASMLLHLPRVFQPADMYKRVVLLIVIESTSISRLLTSQEESKETADLFFPQVCVPAAKSLITRTGTR